MRIDRLIAKAILDCHNYGYGYSSCSSSWYVTSAPRCQSAVSRTANASHPVPADGAGSPPPPRPRPRTGDAPAIRQRYSRQIRQKHASKNTRTYVCSSVTRRHPSVLCAPSHRSTAPTSEHCSSVRQSTAGSVRCWGWDGFDAAGGNGSKSHRLPRRTLPSP